MKPRFLLLVLLLFVSLAVKAQDEVLTPLGSAPWRASWACMVKSGGYDTLTLTLPFFDDFSDYEGLPHPKRWLTTDAFVNNDYANFPPTIGVATFDALKGNGEMHRWATTSLFGADTLASQIIRLDSIFQPTRKKLTPADSIYLSFYYLPGGGTGPLWERLGDAPDSDDSLMVEFWNPVSQQWVMVWGRGGVCEDSLVSQTGHAWQYVAIPVTDADFFSRNFQFRFRNYCSLSVNPKIGMVGNEDQWNIDYVYLAHNRTAAEPTPRDVAFVHKATSPLRSYQAMPARQYRQSEMAAHFSNVITNRYSQTLATNYVYDVYDESGLSVGHYDGGHENAPSFWLNGGYQTSAAHASPAVAFSFPPSAEPHTYRIVHVVKEGTSGDSRPGNDTNVFTQVLGDYYAYDDGIPENGYGLVSTNNKMYLACRYVLNQPDTLTAVNLYFNHTRNEENSGVAFYLSVWAKGTDSLPGPLLYRDEVKQRVRFDGMNRFVRYELSQPLLLNDTVFIGFEQQGNAYINLGFDRTHDAREHIFYRTSSGWQQSILSGALLMRPCFGTVGSVGVEPAPLSVPRLTLYPNPARDVLHLQCDQPLCSGTRVQLLDARGRRLYDGPYNSTLDLRSFKSGLYLLRLVDTESDHYSIHKFIITK